MRAWPGKRRGDRDGHWRRWRVTASLSQSLSCSPTRPLLPSLSLSRSSSLSWPTVCTQASSRTAVLSHERGCKMDIRWNSISPHTRPGRRTAASHRLYRGRQIVWSRECECGCSYFAQAELTLCSLVTLGESRLCLASSSVPALAGQISPYILDQRRALRHLTLPIPAATSSSPSANEYSVARTAA